MQLVLSNNRIIAHGENFIAMGGVVINTETGAKYENATVAECEGGCPSDIDKVGYEYHAGEFVPCAPFGTGLNGNYMIACDECATPRNSGIPIKNGLKRENLLTEDFYSLLWENASPTSDFLGQTITLLEYDWDFLIVETANGSFLISNSDISTCFSTARNIDAVDAVDYLGFYYRECEILNKTTLKIGSCIRFLLKTTPSIERKSPTNFLKPLRIYGVKI